MTLTQRSFADLGTHLSEVTFCVLDLETTGGSPADCEITEIGALLFQGGEPAGTFQTLVNPGAPIPPFITILTGITQAMVIEAPPIDEALPAFLEFLGSAVIVGHNVRFDISFLNAAAERLDYPRLTNPWADTLKLAQRLCRNEVRNLKLDTLAGHFRSPTKPTHRAFDDAAATAHVFWALLERAGTIGVTHLDDLLALRSARGAPNYQKIKLTDKLPRSPGVYLFKDRLDNVIYVGKAKNLRSRVRSYFYGDERRTIHTLLRELDGLDFRVCETELEAEITELRLIAAHKPRHNRRSKPPRTQQWVKLTAERFPRLSIARVQKNDGGLYLGPFRSKRAADLVLTAIWDASPIRRCRGGPKSGRVDLAQGESFGFLGFEFRRIRSKRGRWMPLYMPKGKKRTALLRKLKAIFRSFRSRPVGELIETINPILRGWVQYFAVGHSSRCFSMIQNWVEKKIRRHLGRARQRRGFGWKRWSRPWLYQSLGLFGEYRVSYWRSRAAVASCE